MKIFLLLLPIVLAAPGQRGVLDQLSHLNLFELDALKCDMETMLDALGSDPTEHACEVECTKVVQAGNIMSFGCPLVCQGFKSLVHRLHVTPGHTACDAVATNAPAVGKRFFLDSLHLDSVFQLDSLKCDLQLMLDQLGTAPTEAACESECHTLLAEGHYFNYGCPLVCNGFQNLVHMWHIVPDDGLPAHSKCHLLAQAATTVPSA